MIEGIFNSPQYVQAKLLLNATALRHAALTSNLANVETPGYKRVDVSKSFDVQFQQAAAQNNMKSLAQLTPTISEDTTAAAVRPDGNNVSMDKELMEINRNSADYEFLSQYLSNNIMRLQQAIKSTN